MPPPLPTKAQADGLVAVRKVVSAAVVWNAVGKGCWRLEARALSVDPVAILRVTGFVGRRNHSFALLYDNYPIRKYTKHHRHRSQSQVFTQPHKHTWDGATRDWEAYVPADIDPLSTVDEQFLAFCRECRIDLVGGYRGLATGVR